MTKEIKIPKVLLMILFAIFSLVSFAQADGDGHRQGPRPRFSPEEYKQKEANYITRKANLTPTEATAFFPLFHAMKDQQRKLSFENGRLMRRAWRENLNDAESLSLLNTINNNEEKIQKLEKQYEKRFLKVVSASKLLKIKVAEKSFERKVLSDMARGPKKRPVPQTNK